MLTYTYQRCCGLYTYFMESKGYDVECKGLYQDNTSMLLLMNDGCFLSGKKTKLIKAKFFFIEDMIDGGEMIMINCPIEGMGCRHADEIIPRQGDWSDESITSELC
jgi:hypothetical protein